MFDYSQIENMRRAISSLKELMGTINEITGAMAAYGLDDSLSVDAGGLVELELQRFLLYLMASDGVIADEEVALINRLFDCEFSAPQWKEVIVDTDTYTNDFARTPLLSLRIAAYADEYMRIHGGEDVDVVGNVINGFAMFGKTFVSIDDDVTDSEVDDLTDYISMLRNSVGDARRQARLRLI